MPSTNTQTGSKDGRSGPSDSPTNAPEKREDVESSTPPAEATLRPGGAHGAPVDVGMSELHDETVPSKSGARHNSR